MKTNIAANLSTWQIRSRKRRRRRRRKICKITEFIQNKYRIPTTANRTEEKVEEKETVLAQRVAFTSTALASTVILWQGVATQKKERKKVVHFNPLSPWQGESSLMARWPYTITQKPRRQTRRTMKCSKFIPHD